MKQPTAGLVPLIAIVFGFMAMACLATKAYLLAFGVVSFGLFIWFCLMSALCEASDPPERVARYALGMVFTLAVLTGYLVVDAVQMFIKGSLPSPRVIFGLGLLGVVSHRSWPQIRSYFQTLSSSPRNEP